MASNTSRGGEILLEAFGKIGVNTFVLFFKRDGQRKNLAFRKSVEVLHGLSREWYLKRFARPAPLIDAHLSPTSPRPVISHLDP
jgi:hypothetical protein